MIVRELLTFLERADKEFKPRITAEISQAAERDAPNKRWHVDTILRLLRLVCQPSQGGHAASAFSKLILGLTV